jgi:predicted O-methyltransferase YrrM
MDDALRAAAEAAPGFMPAEEGLALYAAARRACATGPIVEIGTYGGKSTIYLAAA